jgi:hypothetical protein
MKKFLLLIVVVVGAWLALRYVRNRPTHEVAKKPVVTTAPAPAPAAPKPPPAKKPPAPPPPPRYPGSVEVSNAQPDAFALAPGVIYHCERGMMAQPTSGADPERISDCGSESGPDPHDMRADAKGLVFCDANTLWTVPVGAHARTPGLSAESSRRHVRVLRPATAPARFDCQRRVPDRSRRRQPRTDLHSTFQ